MDKDVKWPIVPVHITNDGENCKGDLKKLNETGIIPHEYLEGILGYICAKLICPTSIFEFSPKEEVVRTDIKFKFQELRPSCQEFRKYAGKQYCLDCRANFARLFHKLDKTNIEEVKNKFDTSPIKDYYTKHKEKPKLQQENHRFYLEYYCPFLGYTELAFPIFFEDKVIAVLFLETQTLGESKSFILKWQKKLIKNNPDCFKKYNPIMKFLIKQKIKYLTIKWLKDQANILNPDGYKNIINTAGIELYRLEQILREQVYLQRQSYIQRKVNLRTQEFIKNLTKVSCATIKELKSMWDNVEFRFKDIVNDFHLRYVIVFGTNNIPKEDLHMLDIVVKAGKLPDGMSKHWESVKFKLPEIPQNYHHIPLNSIQYPEFYKCLQGYDGEREHTKSIILLFPVPYIQHTTVIMVGYHDDNLHYSVHNREGILLGEALRSFEYIVFSTFSSIIASIQENYALLQEITAKKTEEVMKNSFRIFGHEISQLTAGLEWLRVLYLASPEELRKLTPNIAEDLCRDIDGYTSLLKMLSKKASMLVSPPKPIKTEFSAFSELLFKWKAMYRLEAEKKRLFFDILTPKPNDPLRSEVYGDIRLLEQVVYNILNNAVKYCYWGTKIYIDCKKENARPYSPHILSITDYGPEIKKEDDDKLYELYYRNKELELESEGLGIGLYIVKQIAIAHEGKICHKSEKISDYNVPLINIYLEQDFVGKDEFLVLKLRNELERLKKAGKYLEVTSFRCNSKTEEKFSKRELINNIIKPTNKVTFFVEIPSKEK